MANMVLTFEVIIVFLNNQIFGVDIELANCLPLHNCYMFTLITYKTLFYDLHYMFVLALNFF